VYSTCKNRWQVVAKTLKYELRSYISSVAIKPLMNKRTYKGGRGGGPHRETVWEG